MNRRKFLTGLGVAAAVVAAAPVVKMLPDLGPGLPTLWADGIRDDAPALQAWIDGRAYYRSSDRTVVPARETNADQVVLPPGDYYLGETLVVHESVVLFDGNNARLRPLRDIDGAMLRVHEAEEGAVRTFKNIYLDGRGPYKVRSALEIKLKAPLPPENLFYSHA